MHLETDSTCFYGASSAQSFRAGLPPTQGKEPLPYLLWCPAFVRPVPAPSLQGILPEYKAAVVGVFDGHGHSGHFVSQFVRDAVMERLKEALDEAETKPRTVGSWTAVLDKVFTRVDQALLEDPAVSAEGSGSTAVMAVRKVKLELPLVRQCSAFFPSCLTLSGSEGHCRTV